MNTLFSRSSPQGEYLFSQGAVILKVLVYLRTTCVGFFGFAKLHTISARGGRGHSGLRRASAEKRSHRGNPRAPGGNHAERRPSLLVKIPQRQLLPSKHAPQPDALSARVCRSRRLTWGADPVDLSIVKAELIARADAPHRHEVHATAPAVGLEHWARLKVAVLRMIDKV